MIERRSVATELRAIGDDLPKLAGYAAVFELESEDMGFFGPLREKISRGAFDYALEKVRAGTDVVYALFNHNDDLVIASTVDNTLDLSVDERGLLAEMTPMDTQLIRDMVVKPIQQGKIRKMSFGFTVADDGERIEKRDGMTIRWIDKIERLFDVSPVTYPAYPQTDIQARALYERLGIPFNASPAAAAQVSRAASAQSRPAGASAGTLRRKLDLRDHIYAMKT